MLSRMGLVISVVFLANSFFVKSDEFAPTGSDDTVYFVQNGTKHYCVNESTIVYAMNGNVSITGTFRNCMRDVVDGLLFPGFVCGQPFNVSTQVLMNNLVSVEEITDAVTFDMFLSLQWVDCRFDMPAFWEQTSENQKFLGINMFAALTTPLVSGNQLAIWKPNILFPESANYQVNNAFIRLFPGGIIQWQQHVVLTLIQTSLSFAAYPHGTHQIILRFYPFTANNQMIQLQPMPCTNTINASSCESGNAPIAALFVGYDGQYSFQESSIWNFDNISGYIGTTAYSNGYRKQSTAFVEFTITRRSQGLVMRLALPILMLVILGAAAFWAEFETRMRTTKVLLDSVAALYVAVFDNFPLLGYLTIFDIYVLSMFYLLFAACMLHQITIGVLNSDIARVWPLRKFYIRVLELLARVAVIPISIGMYLAYFRTSLSMTQFIVTSFMLACFGLFALARESGGLYVAFGKGMQEIAMKLDRLENTSMVEIMIFNRYHYKVFSRSMMHHSAHQKKAALQSQSQQGVQSTPQQDGNIDDSGAAVVEISIEQSPLSRSQASAYEEGDSDDEA